MEDKKTPKVSVIVLTYNQEDTIGEALDSILAQEAPFDYEIVVSDDCSYDSTARICRDYADFYPDKIRFRQTPANLGLVRHYYDTLKLCRGEYIADCAGDDRWTDPLKLFKEAELLDRHPEVTLVHTDWHWLDEATGKRAPGNPDAAADAALRDFVPAGKLIGELLARQGKPLVHSCTAMYRRADGLDAYGRYPELFQADWLPCEDLQLMCALAAKGDVAFIPDSTLDYRTGGDTVSGSKDLAKSFDFTLSTLRLRLRIAEALGIPRDVFQKGIDGMTSYLFGISFIENYHARRDRLLSFCSEEGLNVPVKERILMKLQGFGLLRAPIAAARRRAHHL